VSEVVLGRRIRLMLMEEFPDGAGPSGPLAELASFPPWEHPTPEERAEQAAYERGEIVYVGWQVFADVEDEGRRYELGGSAGGEYAIRLDEDPTTGLLEVLDYARDAFGDLLGDLRIADADVTRFEFYTAPCKVELSPKLRKRLAGLWREREPKDWT